jgi:hypothetical protein
MTRTELVEIIADIAARPRTSINPGLYVQLQGDGLLPRGGPGGNVDLTSAHKINLLLGATLDRAYGTSPGAAVKQWRKRESFFNKRYGNAEELAESLGIKTDDAITALISVLDTINKWPTDGLLSDVRVTATVRNETFLTIMLQRKHYKVTALLTFGTMPDEADEASDKIVYERLVRVPHAAFVRLAQP